MPAVACKTRWAFLLCLAIATPAAAGTVQITSPTPAGALHLTAGDELTFFATTNFTPTSYSYPLSYTYYFPGQGRYEPILGTGDQYGRQTNNAFYSAVGDTLNATDLSVQDNAGHASSVTQPGNANQAIDWIFAQAGSYVVTISAAAHYTETSYGYACGGSAWAPNFGGTGWCANPYSFSNDDHYSASDFLSFEVDVADVPEPATIVLLAASIPFLLRRRRA